MKVVYAKNSGFCFGVKKAVDTAFSIVGKNVYTFGELIHNDYVTEKLAEKGVKITLDPAVLTPEDVVVIRSHGIGKAEMDAIVESGAKVVDMTCPFVKKIHDICEKYSHSGYTVIVLGDANHPEIKGICGRVNGEYIVLGGEDDFELLKTLDKSIKYCVVEQTTFSTEKYAVFLKKIAELQLKTVEIFDTICYTTISRRKEAEELARSCDAVIVMGSPNSSNTGKLYDLCAAANPNTYRIFEAKDVKKLNFSTKDVIGFIAGASVPQESIMEVKKYMSEEVKVNDEFAKGVEESFVEYKPGKRVKGTVISADENGVLVQIGGKKDGLIRKEDAVLNDEEYDPAKFTAGSEVEVKIINANDAESGCVLLSKKAIDAIKEADKIVDTIRDGETFTVKVDKDVKGGLLAKLGTYSVFIPASQIRERFVKDLTQFKDKELVVSALEINDDRRKIVASARKVIEAERKAKEEVFWANVVPNVVVSGVVKRITAFGAFVSVDGFDCLAHIGDLSWTHIKTVDEVLKVGETYDFLVLSADREKNKVSLGYKQLQPHPFVACMEKHPVGSKLTGKVVSVVAWGVFVEVEPHIEGLVHVSEIAKSYVKDINEVVKVGDEVEVMVMSYDEANRKINLSIKACLPDDVKPEAEPAAEGEEAQAKKVKKVKAKKADDEEGKEWSEDTSNNPFADLLKDIEIK